MLFVKNWSKMFCLISPILYLGLCANSQIVSIDARIVSKENCEDFKKFFLLFSDLGVHFLGCVLC